MSLVKYTSGTVLLLLICLQINGAELGSRIVGGSEAFAGQFPFAAAIYVTTSTGRYFCNGILTANQYVITSGHCVYDAQSFTIQLGSSHLNSTDDNRITISTSTYVLHPDFDPNSLNNDIGLIHLRMSISYTEYVHMIHPQEEGLTDGLQVYALGWGSVSESDSNLSNGLRYVMVTTLSNEECRLTYGNQITDNMLCVAGNYNEGTCTGDTGSGLVVQLGRTYAIVGVSSFISQEGCESVHPSGYTRIAPFYDWIVSITHDTGEDS